MTDFFHCGDVAVTLNATDAAVHVNGMIEISIVRHFVDANPWHGRASVEPSVAVAVLARIKCPVLVAILPVIAFSHWFQSR